MNLEKVLVIKGEYNLFEKFYLNMMSKKECSTYSYYNDRHILGYYRKVWIHAGLPYESIWYGNWKKYIKKYNYIIIFDSIVSSKIIKFIKKYKTTDCRLIFWHWNSLKTKSSIRIFNDTKDLCEHWTFDKGDAEKYHMKLNTQFFFWYKSCNTDIEWDIYFIGADKGRFEVLKNIRDILAKQGLKVNIQVFNNSNVKYDDMIITKKVEYEQVLKNIEKSRCVLEICQDGQEGLTARALEAMFLGKKLVTNNKGIINTSFYNSNNIYLIDKDNVEGIVDFLKIPFENLKSEQLYPYSFEGWLNKFDNLLKSY